MTLDTSHANTKTRAGFFRKDDPSARFAAARIAASPPEQPMPCSSIFSTPARSPSSFVT